MPCLLRAATALLLVGATGLVQAEPVAYQLDPVHTRVAFRIDFTAPPTEEAQALVRDCLDSGLADYLGLYGDKTRVTDPATGRRSVDLAASREIIDSLVELREKTRGRLSFEETDSLEGLLGELQLVFTRLAAQAKGAPGMPPPPRPRG